MFQILIVPDALEELEEIPSFYRRQVEQAVRRQLMHEPMRPARNRKCLRSAVVGFEFEPPLWELRIGVWRVFYDVEDEKVVIRAFRKKPPSKKTEDIL